MRNPYSLKIASLIAPLFLVVSLLTGGCEEEPGDLEQAIEGTSTRAETTGVQPTSEAEAIVTSEAEKPEPTATPEPKPTATPVALSGTGPDVVDVPPGPALLYVTGNAEERHFAVTGHDAEGNQTDLYVNTTHSYEGVVPFDFTGEETTRLQVEAPGAWTIELRPLTSARVIGVPGNLSGSGDDVLLVDGEPDTAVLTGNTESRHFAVVAWSDTSFDLLANTTDPYQGRVIIPADTLLIEITATGPWEISLE